MTNYTTEERREIAEAFKAAKTYLWDGREDAWKSTCICKALDDTRLQPETVRRAKLLIMKRLGGYFSVYAWLRDFAKVPSEQLSDQNVQTHRHAWLDLLIEELTSKSS